MHGLIFVTWENYLATRFGNEVLNRYRSMIGETVASAPLVNRVYDDATLLAGVQAACQLTQLPAETLLREYGRYYILNGLTSHRCAYLLTQVHSGRALLLRMREAHAQLRRTPEGLTPPLFRYEALSADPDTLVLIYDSPRRLCSVLLGAIEGAALRYGEQVRIVERSCMKRGEATCRFELHFTAPSAGVPLLESAHQRVQQQAQQQLADLVLSVLPTDKGLTLAELQASLRFRQVSHEQLRPRVLFDALLHLQHAGLVASTANQPGEVLANRHYWRVPTWGNGESGMG